MVWCLGKFEKLIGKSLFFMWEKLGTFCEILMRFLWKIFVGKNLKLVNLNVNFKIFSWEILLGIFLPKLVGKVLYAILGVFFWKCSCGQTCLEHWWNFEDIILGTLGESWENFYLGNVILRNLEFLFGKRLLLSTFVEQNFGKFYLGNFCVFDLGVFVWEIFIENFTLGKLCFPRSNMVDWLTDNFLGEEFESHLAYGIVLSSLVTLSHHVRKFVLWRLPLLLCWT